MPGTGPEAPAVPATPVLLVEKPVTPGLSSERPATPKPLFERPKTPVPAALEIPKTPLSVCEKPRTPVVSLDAPTTPAVYVVLRLGAGLSEHTDRRRRCAADADRGFACTEYAGLHGRIGFFRLRVDKLGSARAGLADNAIFVRRMTEYPNSGMRESHHARVPSRVATHAHVRIGKAHHAWFGGRRAEHAAAQS